MWFRTIAGPKLVQFSFSRLQSNSWPWTQPAIDATYTWFHPTCKRGNEFQAHPSRSSMLERKCSSTNTRATSRVGLSTISWTSRLRQGPYISPDTVMWHQSYCMSKWSFILGLCRGIKVQSSNEGWWGSKPHTERKRIFLCPGRIHEQLEYSKSPGMDFIPQEDDADSQARHGNPRKVRLWSSHGHALI